MGEVVGNDAPTDPFIEAIVTVVETTTELMFVFEHTDAAFDARLEAATAFEPRLLFMLAPGVIFAPGHGQDDALDAFVGGIGFIIR